LPLLIDIDYIIIIFIITPLPLRHYYIITPLLMPLELMPLAISHITPLLIIITPLRQPF
jgi:hypothetical protein